MERTSKALSLNKDTFKEPLLQKILAGHGQDGTGIYIYEYSAT
jgi:hypothetical protein